MLPIITEIFGSNPFPLHAEYIALPKRQNSRILVADRRMAFERYCSFVLTDFFQGLRTLSEAVRGLQAVFPDAKRTAAEILHLP